MKLRNKKTGEIADLAKKGLLRSEYTGNHILVYPEGTQNYYAYISLAKFNEEWEDYKPVEPLIKDEQARAIVKSWYDRNNITGELRSYGGKHWLGLRGSDKADVDWKIELYIGDKSLLDNDGLYSLTELIGDEE